MLIAPVLHHVSVPSDLYKNEFMSNEIVVPFEEVKDESIQRSVN